jgi:hypothetical protein
MGCGPFFEKADAKVQSFFLLCKYFKEKEILTYIHFLSPIFFSTLPAFSLHLVAFFNYTLTYIKKTYSRVTIGLK